MTQIRGFIGATRRAGELGVHSLDGFNLVVPDMKIAEIFYSEFGLDLQARGNRFDILTQGHSHRWGTIMEGSRKHLSHLSFGVFEDDFPRFKERLNRVGITLLDPPKGLESNGSRFELLPLHPRSVGQLRRILSRYRLHSGQLRLAGHG
jgi:hypothetical protein